MAKMMKRLIAAAITVSMLTSVIAVPVFAAEEEGSTPSVTVEIKNEGGEVIGTMTTNTTNSSDGSTTTTNKEWTTTETTQKPGDTQNTGENTTQKTDSSTTVEKDGQETIVDKVVADDKSITESGSSVGSETTTTTTTTTVTTTTENAELEKPEVDTKPGQPDEKLDEAGDLKEGDGEGNTSSEWEEIPEENVEGKWEAVPESEKSTTETVKPEHDGSVKLEMTTQKKEDIKEIAITVEDLMDVPENATVEAITDANGKTIGYKVTTYTDEEPGKPGEILEDSESGEGKKPGKTKTESNIVYLNKSEYTVGKVEVKDENGNVIGDKVTTELEDGTGYKITETIVKNDPIKDEASTDSFEGKDQFVTKPVLPEGAQWTDENQTSYIQLPKRPEDSESVDADGKKTVVSWEAVIDETSNAVIGYKTTTTVTDKDGKLVSRESETEYGTITTFGTTVTTDPETKQTTTVTETYVQGLKQIQTYIEKVKGYQETTSTRVGTEDAYTLVETENGKLVFMYKGEMYEVDDNSKNAVMEFVAGGSRDGSTGAVQKDNFISEGDDSDLRLQGEKVDGNKTISGYYSDQDFTKRNDVYDKNGNWTMIGYGLFSDFAAKETNGDNHQTKMFKLERKNADGTKEYQYVYCVEMGVNTSGGVAYGTKEYNDAEQNGGKITWNNATNNANSANGTIGELRSVCVNGFWGTEEGLGSLQAVQDLMRRNNLGEYADQLTAGMALTATQVAIWEFGTKTSNPFGGEGYDFVKEFNQDDNNSPSASDYDAVAADEAYKKEIIIALRDLLVKLAKEEKGKTDLNSSLGEVIDKEDVTATSITLNNKVTEKNGSGESVVRKDSNGNELYNADLGFTLDVSTSSINGDLKVTVKQGDKTIGYYRLAGDEEEDLLDKVFYKGKIYPDANGTYTLTGLELAEGVQIDLQLSGTQHLDDGIYVFQDNDSSNWQDFVGLATLEKEIDLTISMEFEAVDPELTHTHKEWNESKTDKKAYTRDNYYHTEAFGTKTTENVTVTTKVFGTVTQTDTKTESTQALREWETYYEDTTPIEEGGFFTLVRNNGENPVVIIDEQVPLARAPKTGDASVALVMVILFATCGLVIVNRKRELI